MNYEVQICLENNRQKNKALKTENNFIFLCSNNKSNALHTITFQLMAIPYIKAIHNFRY